MIVVQCWTAAWILFEILPQASQACKWSSLRVLLCTCHGRCLRFCFRAGQRLGSRLGSSLTQVALGQCTLYALAQTGLGRLGPPQAPCTWYALGQCAWCAWQAWAVWAFPGSVHVVCTWAVHMVCTHDCGLEAGNAVPSSNQCTGH